MIEMRIDHIPTNGTSARRNAAEHGEPQRRESDEENLDAMIPHRRSGANDDA